MQKRIARRWKPARTKVGFALAWLAALAIAAGAPWKP
jgi:hypothetical protein